MGTLVQVQLYTFSSRMALYRPQKWPKITVWGWNRWKLLGQKIFPSCRNWPIWTCLDLLRPWSTVAQMNARKLMNVNQVIWRTQKVSSVVKGLTLHDKDKTMIPFLSVKTLTSLSGGFEWNEWIADQETFNFYTQFLHSYNKGCHPVRKV